jgi:hypothetical protein
MYVGISDSEITLKDGSVVNSEDTNSSEGWNVEPARPPGQKKYVVANLYQCKNLPAADSDGNSDPYVQIYCGNTMVETGHVERENTLNPVWYRTLVLRVACNSIEDAPPIVIRVMDNDFGTDDLLG